MPLKIYRDKKSRNATIFINVDGKDLAIEFTGGTVSYGNNTGCYATNDLKIQKALEERKDFCKDRFADTGNFYIENSIETDEEIKANEAKINTKKIDADKGMIIESKNISGNDAVGEYENILNDMVKEQLNIPVTSTEATPDETTPEETTNTEATPDETTPEETTNTETTPDETTNTETTNTENNTDKNDVLNVVTYMQAKFYLIRNHGATPEDVKNKEAVIAYCEKNQINLPNFK